MRQSVELEAGKLPSEIIACMHRRGFRRLGGGFDRVDAIDMQCRSGGNDDADCHEIEETHADKGVDPDTTELGLRLLRIPP